MDINTGRTERELWQSNKSTGDEEKMLTRKDEETYLTVKEFIQAHGYAPSYREICKLTDTTSTSTVKHRLNKLFTAGCFETENPKSPRALRIQGMRIIFPDHSGLFADTDPGEEDADTQ